MSILDKYPAPWQDNGDSIVDANGAQVLFHPSMLGCASSLIMDLAAELAAARAENERLREALQDMLHFFRGNYCDPSKVIEQAEAALRKAGVE